MKKILSLLFCALLFSTCGIQQHSTENIISSDIDNFWRAYDKIIATPDTTEQYQYLKEWYIDKGSPGLKGIIQSKNYTPQEYLEAIRNYPQFWNSIRPNTLRAKDFSTDLAQGIEKLRNIYPDLKPAKIYFTIGALRTGGTARDSMVLIGSELAMADKNTVTSEFPEPSKSGRRQYFDTNPINSLVLLNIHEYVHTQQRPIVHNLLSYCLYEGVAEFVSVKAMGLPSAAPAVHFGKENEARVKQKFEQDVFKGDNTNQWLWSDAPNDFKVRDLGYYIGYEICERYYEKATDKKAAIKTMIELDYTDEAAIETFIDGTHFFSASIGQLYADFEKRRPQIVVLSPFENGNQKVDPRLTQVSLHFSTPMDTEQRGFDYGPLGETNVLRVEKVIGFSEDGKTFTFEVALEANKQYQSLVTNRFRTPDGMPLKPYLIDFKTGEQ